MTPRPGSTKILSHREVVRRFGPGRGLKLVFTNGCFDLLHAGHTRYLEQARMLGDALVVGVNSDASARGLNKGVGRPWIDEKDRAAVVAALESVDAVCLFDEDTPTALITDLLPDVLVKGADYRLDQVAGREVVEASGGRVELIPLVEGKSTTDIIKRIREEHE